MDGNENLFEREAEESYGPHIKKQGFSEVNYEFVPDQPKPSARECSLDNFRQERAETSVEKALFAPQIQPFSHQI